MGIAFDAEITHCFFGTIEDFLEKYSFKYDLQSGNCVLNGTMGVYVSGYAKLCSLGCTVLTPDVKDI